MKIKKRFILLTLCWSYVANSHAITDFSIWNLDVSLSGFATAGFAISDKNYKYQRFVNNDGSFKRDSLIGTQIYIKLSNQFSLTAQGKLAHSLKNDQDIDPILTWAFLSWRPTNSLLLRAGRLRGPVYLNNANMDIGTTFDFARLPFEVYSTVTTADIDGVLANKTWNFDLGELSLEGYVGTNYSFFRKSPYSFDSLSAPAEFFPIRMNAYGLAISFQHNDSLVRISAHDTYTSCANCTKGNYFRQDFPYVSIAPNIGYYKVSNQMPGEDLPEVRVLHTPVYTAALDLDLTHGFRFMGEYVRRNVRNISTGVDTEGGYIALLKCIENWTPYVSIASLQSVKTLDLYHKVNNNVVPFFIPNAKFLNATQKAGAASIPAYDQTTWAIGTSYKIDTTSKIKAEWAMTDIGDVSSFIDSPSNEGSGNRLIHVFSLSYNIVF